MSDCHDLFITFHETVSVSSARKSQLQTSRNALRERIRTHFTDIMKVSAPKFHGQGSYSMGTLVNPLRGRYDIDDGVYLQHLSQDRNRWPSAAIVHGWLIEAARRHTDEPPQGRDRCVRVTYKADPPYHVDLPVYVMDGRAPQLFDTSREKAREAPVSPYESDPAAMTAWFNDRVDRSDQLRRIVRYAKAWKDFKSDDGAKVAKGLLLAILLAETLSTHDRDDVALSQTIDAANTRVKRDPIIRKPVSPFEDLTEKWTRAQRVGLLKCLEQFRDLAHDAVVESDKGKAASIWRKLFGDRFPDSEPEPQGKKGPALRTASPAVIGRDGRSA